MSMTPVAAETWNPDRDSLECPVCRRTVRRAHRCKTLFGVRVCRRCRNGFANRRQAAYLVDAFLYVMLAEGAVAAISRVLFAASAANQPASTAVTSQDEFVVYLTTIMGYLVLPFLFTFNPS